MVAIGTPFPPSTMHELAVFKWASGHAVMPPGHRDPGTAAVRRAGEGARLCLCGTGSPEPHELRPLCEPALAAPSRFAASKPGDSQHCCSLKVLESRVHGERPLVPLLKWGTYLPAA